MSEHVHKWEGDAASEYVNAGLLCKACGVRISIYEAAKYFRLNAPPATTEISAEGR